MFLYRLWIIVVMLSLVFWRLEGGRGSHGGVAQDYGLKFQQIKEFFFFFSIHQAMHPELNVGLGILEQIKWNKCLVSCLILSNFAPYDDGLTSRLGMFASGWSV